MEMAIKLKAKELEIPTKKRKRDKRLVDIINNVFENEHLRFLKPDFDRARNFRNIKMHPDKLMYMGAMGFTDANTRLFVNTINLLFLEKEQLDDLHKKINDLETKLAPFKNGLHVLEFENNKILIDGFHTFKYRELNHNTLLILYVNPLTTNVHEQFVKHKYPEPLVITFTDFHIKTDKIEGVDLEGKPMLIYINDKDQNKNTYYNYNEELSKVSESDIDTYISWNSSTASWKIEKVIYENCWLNTMAI